METTSRIIGRPLSHSQRFTGQEPGRTISREIQRTSSRYPSSKDSQSIMSLDEFLLPERVVEVRPTTVVNVSKAGTELMKSGVTSAVNILGDDLNDDQIQDISENFKVFMEDEVYTSYTVANMKANGNVGESDVQLTHLGLISKAFHSITKSEVKFEHPFRSIMKVTFVWTPLFGKIEGTETSLCIKDKRTDPPTIVSQVTFNNSKNVMGCIGMNYCVAREDEDKIKIGYQTDMKPIAEGAYGALFMSINSLKTCNPLKQEVQTPEVVYLGDRAIPKSVNAKEALKIGRDVALKKIEEAKKKAAESAVSAPVHVTRMAKSELPSKSENSDFGDHQVFLMDSTINPEMDDYWVLDSGASDHYLKSEHKTEDIINFNPAVIRTHKGYMLENFILSMNPSIVLPGVILSPDLTTNLLSESALIASNIIDKIITYETKKICYKNGIVLFEAFLIKKLYRCPF